MGQGLELLQSVKITDEATAAAEQRESADGTKFASALRAAAMLEEGPRAAG